MLLTLRDFADREADGLAIAFEGRRRLGLDNPDPHFCAGRSDSIQDQFEPISGSQGHVDLDQPGLVD